MRLSVASALVLCACQGPADGLGGEGQDAGRNASPSPTTLVPIPDPAAAGAGALAADREVTQVATAPEALDPAAVARAREAAQQARFEATYPMYGMVYHFVAQVFPTPSDSGQAIGYLRRGAQLRAGPRVDGTGCRAGWHQVPGGGYVCDGRGFQISSEPLTYDGAPMPAALDDALPYAYAYTTGDDVPQYWQLPTLVEENAAAEAFARLRAVEQAAGSAPSPEATADDEGQADQIEAPPPPGQEEETGSPDGTTAAGSLPSFVRMRMLRGFYVSLDRREISPLGRMFYRTVRGAYVRTTSLTENTPPDARGVVLGASWTLPLGITFRRGMHYYLRDPNTGRLRNQGEIDRHRAIVVADDRVDYNNRRYVLSQDGILVRDTAVRIARQVPRPPGVEAGERWIHVRLSEQTLVAYEGDTPVFATVVSTGKEGYETPTGLYQVQSKHVSTTMDDDTNPEGSYSIEDVPWTMYFHGNYALHGAFWHYTFGRVRSHGCVNLAPADARWLFQWSTPTLPAAWHGVFAASGHDGERVGTWVYIEE